MKKLALVAIILLAGCASSNARTSDSDPKLAQLEKKSLAIAESEKRCIDETPIRSCDKMAGMAATPGASVESHRQRENDERDREISQCRAWADQENAEIAEQERNEYELQAQQERSRASFMAIVTTSTMH
ncbi:MAG: hypothetical protein WBP51_11770 [Candidatus Sulfotelmatobacter sp.]